MSNGASTFAVCGDVSVTPTGSFNWSNSNTKAVTITPVTSWPLSQNSYSIGAGKTTSLPIPITGNPAVGNSYSINVKYDDGTSPCGGGIKDGGNPKIIIVNPTKK